ncbi:MAG: butyrate kinase [Bacteroidales bacterium]|nr:butyrate kinase [Bacteroidales bacterium]MBR3745146.1 butyrate kinase [Bacteroidales bacterium]
MAKGTILVVNTGSITTKFALYKDGACILEKKLEHSVEELSKFADVMDQDGMRTEAILKALKEIGVRLEDIDIVMCRGGLFTPCVTGVYNVNADMREVLSSSREGNHACNLSALIGDNIAGEINAIRGKDGPFGPCVAYVADPPMADEMLPECHVGGIPEFPRRTLFHALNTRAIMRRYLRDTGRKAEDTTAIICHMGGGVTISLHRDGRVIDTSHGLGGDGPITPERAGCCPPYPLIDMCFSGKYTKQEIKKKLIGKGGAVAYFGTNDMRVVVERAQEGQEEYVVFLKAFVLNIAKYIVAQGAVVDGKVDVIILTGGVAYSKPITDAITKKVEWLAPVRVYPGENELESLAENGYMILAGETKIHTYNKDHIIED